MDGWMALGFRGQPPGTRTNSSILSQSYRLCFLNWGFADSLIALVW